MSSACNFEIMIYRMPVQLPSSIRKARAMRAHMGMFVKTGVTIG